MARPVTLCTAQWADLPLEVLAKKAAEWGYDGLELACWGDHMDVDRAATDKDYCNQQLEILNKNGLKLFTLYIEVNIDKEQAYDPRLKEYRNDFANGLYIFEERPSAQIKGKGNCNMYFLTKR